MKVLIAGAGIGGLSAAIALQNDGHEVYCFDRVREMRPIGAAISGKAYHGTAPVASKPVIELRCACTRQTVWSNGVKALKSFGLDPMQYSGKMDRMAYLKHDSGEALCDFPLDELYAKVCTSHFTIVHLKLSMSGRAKVKERACPIARTDLQKILYDGAGHEKVTLNKQVADYTATESGITIKFTDGEEVAGDFLVIADGTHSRLRNKICAQTIERKYVGYINFNAALPQSTLKVSIIWLMTLRYVAESIDLVGNCACNHLDAVCVRTSFCILLLST